MLNQYGPNTKAIIVFLKLLRVKINNATVNETLQNHPDWPTFLSLSDSLTKWNIPNGVGKTDDTEIDQIPTPFIAHTNNQEAPLAIVTTVTDSTIVYYLKNHSKTNTDSREDFLKKWNGVYLIAEPNEHSGETNYEANRRNTFFSSLVPVCAIITIIAISFLLLYKNIGVANSSLSVTGIYLQYILLLAGISVATLLLWYEIDKNNPLLQKVCTGITKGNCNAILSGKQSKVFEWLSWSEVGFFYFTGGLLLMIFMHEKSLSILAWLNILALPYPVFSIYYQWRVAKQWCVLCLAVQALLVLGGINVIASGFLFPLPNLSVSFLLSAALLYLLPVFIWYTCKPFVLQLQQAKNTKREYLRIKFNTEIFETLLRKQKQITVPTDGLGIDLGNPNAANILVKVCSPYCSPCANAHPKIEELLEKNSNLKVKIIFAVPNKPDHFAFKPVSHLLAISEHSVHKNHIKQSLDDWYKAENKDYDKFAAKYPMNGELTEQGNKIEVMDKWCDAMKIEFTPTIFINGNQLPEAYSIEDLQYFLLDNPSGK